MKLPAKLRVLPLPAHPTSRMTPAISAFRPRLPLHAAPFLNFRVAPVCALAMVASVALTARSPGATIYTNLSPGQTYNDGTGASLEKPVQAAVAVAFTPGADYALTDIAVGITYISGLNSVNLELLGDSLGLPGALLQSWTLTNLPTFGLVHTLQSSQTITGISGITLNAGTQYWLAAIPTGSPGRLAWNYDNYPTANPGTVSYGAQSFDGGLTWGNAGYSSGLGALEVSGTAVPEPGTCALLVTGLGVLTLATRRR